MINFLIVLVELQLVLLVNTDMAVPPHRLRQIKKLIELLKLLPILCSLKNNRIFAPDHS